MGLFHVLLLVLDVFLVNLDDMTNYESLGILLCFEYILMGLFALKSLIVFVLQSYEKVFKAGGWDKKSAFLSAPITVPNEEQ